MCLWLWQTKMHFPPATTDDWFAGAEQDIFLLSIQHIIADDTKDGFHTVHYRSIMFIGDCWMEL